MINMQLTNVPQLLVILVHGTFAPDAPWTMPDSDLQTALRNDLDNPQIEIVQRFGRNTFADRIAAGMNILKLVPATWEAPEYPRQSRRLHECSAVDCTVYVLPSGSVESVKIIKSSTERLSVFTQETVKAWTFYPFKSPNEASSIAGNFKAIFRLLDQNGNELQCQP